MFGKSTSISLLAKADKAEQVAERAMAMAQEARTNAARKRQLAARTEMEEAAVRLEKEAAAAVFQFNRSQQDFHLATHERNIASVTLEAAEQNMVQIRMCCESMADQKLLAVRAAEDARAKVQPTVDED